MWFIFGLLIGGLFGWLVSHFRKPAGAFVMDFTDPMKDICRIELDESINEMYNKKKILLRVNVIE